MRTPWIIVTLAVALVAQLSVLNGLHLPGGGVPDLVLVLVAALAMASGPVNGMVIGFAVGLCIDLAPPGSQVLGQYALVFCLTGWAAGRLRPVPGHSARQSAGLVATGLLALVVAGAEVLSTAVGKLLTPASVSLSQLRLALPSTIVYDWLLCPIVLSVVMLAGALLAERSATADAIPALAGTRRSRRAERRARRLPELRLGREARKAGEGWLSISRPASQPVPLMAGHASARLRPAAGVPGSASGLRHQDGRLPAGAPVRLRLGRGRPGDGVIGSGVRQTAARPAAGRTFRPHGGEAGGSAAQSYHLARAIPAQRQARIRFGSQSHQPAKPTPAGRQPRIRFGSQSHQPAKPIPAGRQARIRFGAHPAVLSSGPQLRMAARRSAAGAAGSAVVPSLTFAKAAAVPAQRRAVASPRFRRGSGSIGSGALTESALRIRRQQASPRLHLSSTPPGMLGGSGRSRLRARPPGRPRKQPRFSYGKRSPLSFLTAGRRGRGLGGRWLTRRRAGTRSGVWLIGRRGGGLR